MSMPNDDKASFKGSIKTALESALVKIDKAVASSKSVAELHLTLVESTVILILLSKYVKPKIEE